MPLGHVANSLGFVSICLGLFGGCLGFVFSLGFQLRFLVFLVFESQFNEMLLSMLTLGFMIHVKFRI